MAPCKVYPLLLVLVASLHLVAAAPHKHRKPSHSVINQLLYKAVKPRTMLSARHNATTGRERREMDKPTEPHVVHLGEKEYETLRANWERIYPKPEEKASYVCPYTWIKKELKGMFPPYVYEAECSSELSPADKTGVFRCRSLAYTIAVLEPTGEPGNFKYAPMKVNASCVPTFASTPTPLGSVPEARAV